MDSKSKIRYHERIDKGLCPRCGKKQDGEKVYCSICREKIADTRKFFQEIHICPNCRENELFGSEKICLECKAYMAEKNRISRDKHKRQYNEHKNQKSKTNIIERKAKGLCTRCGKRNATPNFSTCKLCRVKYTQYKRNSRDYKGLRVSENWS